MSDEKLQNQLIDKTIEQRNKILTEANEKSRQILENAEAEKLRIMEQTNKSIEGIIGSELRAVHDRIVGRAELEGRRELMDARMELLEKVYNEAKESLRIVASGQDESIDYQSILKKLINESDQAITDESYIISANNNDIKYLKEIKDEIKNSLGKEVMINSTPIDIIGGVVVQNPDGTKTLENTLENRLNEVTTRLQPEIAIRLGVI
jgi:vacuolar-type H+-ATPase subunit E/Vma4